MGVLSFIAQMQAANAAKDQAEKDRQARLAEIAAQGQNQINVLERSNKLAEQQRREQDLEKWRTSALGDIKRKSDLSAILYSQDPNMMKEEALPAAGLAMKNIELQPELLKASSAMAKNEFNTGITPLMRTLGGASTQADIINAKAREAEGLNLYNTNVERMATMPMAASAEDKAKTAEANQRATSAMTTLPGLAKVIPAQQEATVADANLQAAKAAQEAKVFPLLSAPAEAEARNANNLATSATAGLIQRSGGALTPGYGSHALANPYLNPNFIQGILQQILTSSMTNRNGVTTNAAPVTPTTVPVRAPINLKNLGITIPME